MRVVSLVPSLTLTLAELGVEASQVVGRTPWCIHPKPFVKDIPVVGGTKTPNLNKILNAQPDLVILDREENPKQIHDKLVEFGIETFVSTVERPSDVPDMLRQLGQRLNRVAKADELAQAIDSELQHSDRGSGPIVLPLIWHDPLMAVSPKKYSGALLEACGFRVPEIEPEGNGYPIVTAEHIQFHAIEGLLLSSEPHEFSKKEGEQISDAVEAIGGQRPWTKCIDGEALTWFGSHTLSGLRVFKELCKDLKTAKE
ncbi:MAG: helical backbone metal receptor [Candidatus Thermoplasmatota archaeon]|nr:helical backbone metal receptor [Candidatus Thermoplasmatota archaeon]